MNLKQSTLATFTRNFLLRVMQFSDLKVTHSVKVVDFICSEMCFDSSNQFLAVGSNLGSIKIFSPQLQLTHEFQGKGGAVLAMQFHPNYQKLELYCGSEDCMLRVYDLVLNKIIKTVQMQGSLISNQAMSWTQPLTTK